jgi:uncharacterized protein (TIGR02231 family)
MVGLTTTIIAATVFPDWVRLTRRGSVKLHKGTHTVEIFGLPGNLNPETLRVTIYGSENPRLLGVHLKPIFNTDQLFKSADQLVQEIQNVEDELKQLGETGSLIKQNRSILDKLVGQTDTYANALASGTITAEKQIDVLDQLRAQTQKLDQEAHALQLTLRAKEQLRDKLATELESARNSVPQKTFTAIVDVELSASTELTIEVSYVVDGVSWKPVYDLRLLEKRDSPSLEVSYLADVTQTTGENWEEISLALSTARPALSSRLPELEPWFVHLTNSSAFKSEEQHPGQTQVNNGYQSADRGPEEMPASEPINEGKADQTGFAVDTAVSYLINNLISIPSDSFQHKVPIARFFLVPELNYQATPKLSQAVYRQAVLENNSNYTLLPGIANIIIGDEYVGSISFELTVPGEKFEVFLGNDNRIKVERELKRRDIDKRMLWGKRHIILGYQIKIESLLHHQAVVTIYDQIPTPTNEDIKVKLESATPKPAEQTKLNQLVWNLVLEPKETRVIDFEFSIDAPPGKEIFGL